MNVLEKILEEIIEQLKAEGCITDDAAGNMAEEIVLKHMYGSKDINIPSNDEIEPVSKEFLKDCKGTAKKYKRENNSWIPMKNGLPKEKGWYCCTCSDKEIWGKDIVRQLYYYPERKQFVDNIKYESNGLKEIEKFFWTKYVTAWQPLPEPYKTGQNSTK